ncbi:MAG: 3-hydroxyacyl-CoA dehydrogenase family protein [bacterium]
MLDGMRRVAVLGAGTMGHGIAQVAAMSGFVTVLFDVDDGLARRGVARIRENLDKGVQRGKVDTAARDGALARLEATSDLARAARDADVVVEAAPERMDLKQRIFREVSAAAGERAILATNTSSLSVTEIAQAATHPERVVGTHFFNPPWVLTLLEIVRGAATSDDTIERTKDFGTRMGREMIVVADSPGFATSRLGVVLGLEAMRMLEAGVASAEDIDRAMQLGYRHPMGPLELSDLVGLDVRLDIAEHLHAKLGGEQYRPPEILKRLVREGKLGKKTGQGFRRWNE